MTEKMENYLKALANMEVKSDDANYDLYDYCGGNYDDAFGLGYDDGQIQLARKILEDLSIKW